MIIFVDIDKTICTDVEELVHKESWQGYLRETKDYSKAQPIQERIDHVNKLYDAGHTIVYWTARGSKTLIDWEETTKNQFKKWGIKFHELRFKKPHYDLFIDDKNINSETYFEGELNGTRKTNS
ncbi:hypothetical protein CL614_08515 [archaeon]|nr:hypothetical protein [archaeon]|tara:strand:+ start:1931 stop:2302 length:372 start_codon:yes stop_codon:yes gene_type:complete